MHANSSSTAARVQIELAERSYPIVIGNGLLGNQLTYQDLPKAATALVVSNTTVAPLYAAQLSQALRSVTPRCCW
jgi:3-dehydroquinate synthase